MIPTTTLILDHLRRHPATTERLSEIFDTTADAVAAVIDSAPDTIEGTCAGSITGKDHAAIVWHIAEPEEVQP